jgi:hypothetical protein
MFTGMGVHRDISGNAPAEGFTGVYRHVCKWYSKNMCVGNMISFVK